MGNLIDYYDGPQSLQQPPEPVLERSGTLTTKQRHEMLRLAAVAAKNKKVKQQKKGNEEMKSLEREIRYRPALHVSDDVMSVID